MLTEKNLFQIPKQIRKSRRNLDILVATFMDQFWSKISATACPQESYAKRVRPLTKSLYMEGQTFFRSADLGYLPLVIGYVRIRWLRYRGNLAYDQLIAAIHAYPRL